jgi:transcriptional regulator with XRE-family HTH domain
MTWGMEALTQYLAKSGTTQSRFAESIRVSQATVSRYLSGSLPSAAVMARILDVTDGEVRPDHFFEASQSSIQTPRATSPARGQGAAAPLRSAAPTKSPA